MPVCTVCGWETTLIPTTPGITKTLFDGKRGPKPVAVAAHSDPEVLFGEIGKLNIRPNQVWSTDITFITLLGGGKFSTINESPQSQIKLQNEDDKLRYGNIDQYGDDKCS